MNLEVSINSTFKSKSTIFLSTSDAYFCALLALLAHWPLFFYHHMCLLALEVKRQQQVEI